jgi:hypothetical protein
MHPSSTLLLNADNARVLALAHQQVCRWQQLHVDLLSAFGSAALGRGATRVPPPFAVCRGGTGHVEGYCCCLFLCARHGMCVRGAFPPKSSFSGLLCYEWLVATAFFALAHRQPRASCQHCFLRVISIISCA